MNTPWNWQPLGDTGVLLQLGETIDPGINQRVLSLEQGILERGIAGLVETVPSYASLLLVFDPLQADHHSILQQLPAPENILNRQETHSTCWSVPVCYGGRHGVDLESLATRLSLSPDELVTRHMATEYRVYMIGFAPGYTYLGGLDPALHCPRRPDPRLETPAGSISIGGEQTLIAGVSMPSGWHLIGRTPLVTWQANRQPVMYIQPGDRVQFCPWPDDEFEPLAEASAAGEWQPERLRHDG